MIHTAKALIGPSLLACDLSNIANESLRVMAAGADFLHLDVMDGHFVPNLTFGAPVISCLRRHTSAVLDVHLMVSHPAQWVDDMKAAGTDIFTFHVEAVVAADILPLITKIKSTGMKVGLAIKPATSIDSVLPFLDQLDQVLVMTVEPGFGGQSFMHNMMPKVEALRLRCPHLNIEVDGGLGLDTIDAAARAGANMIVAGSSIFKNSPGHVISLLKRSVEKHGNGMAEDKLTAVRPPLPLSLP